MPPSSRRSRSRRRAIVTTTLLMFIGLVGMIQLRNEAAMTTTSSAVRAISATVGGGVAADNNHTNGGDQSRIFASNNQDNSSSSNSSSAGSLYSPNLFFRECLEEQLLHMENPGEWTSFKRCAMTKLNVEKNQLTVEQLHLLLQGMHRYKQVWQDAAMDDDDDTHDEPDDGGDDDEEKDQVDDNEDGRRPRNLRLVFIGDSLTRYMYLSLVYYLRHGQWEALNAHPSMVLEKTHDSWMDFYQWTSNQLAPYETCDCYRSDNGPVNTHRICENRYYFDSRFNNSVVYLQKFGHQWAKGHFFPDEINARINDTTKPYKLVQEHVKPTWAQNWTGVIRDYVAKLEPKPTHVIFNSGKWGDKELTQVKHVKQIQHALADAGMQGVYKTTTKSMKDTPVMERYEQLLCNVMPHCLDLSWTGRLARAWWWDFQHYREPVYRIMNERLLTRVLGFDNLRGVLPMTGNFQVRPFGNETKLPLWAIRRRR